MEIEPRRKAGEYAMPDRLEQLRFSLLDFKVGFRMLARRPGPGASRAGRWRIWGSLEHD